MASRAFLRDPEVMSEIAKHKPADDPWIIGFPFLRARRTAGGRRQGTPPRSSWLIAFRCRLRRSSLDRRLAAGADPNASECLCLRACELTGASSRRDLAAGYERLLVAATSFPQLEVLRVNWRAVRDARSRVDRLVERLQEDRGVRVQGLARARLLLTDADSVLYARDDSSLAHELRSTLALL